jgi:hypothetical protein
MLMKRLTLIKVGAWVNLDMIQGEVSQDIIRNLDACLGCA